ncbi:hypothetical protein EHS25_000529 [Saitozyma podzolica]|uniref:Yippee domain-containing protein n=1 Tax=Saitozyma podzolica TaxID=1890683 RepID=A0A427YWH2_9TREE|nr:hypothetical protein EHS25_000529 [Saitozyma podzolica]
MTPSPTTDDSESQTLSKLHLHIVPDDKPVFACHKCSEVVGDNEYWMGLKVQALQDELVSKAFNGRSGRAYLMNSTINTALGKREERKLLALPHLFLFDSPLTHLGLMSVSHTACLPASHHLVYFGPVLIPKLG